MSAFITDSFAGALADQLKAIKVDKVYGRGLDAAAGDAREHLEYKAQENGYFDVADAMRIVKDSPYVRTVGVSSKHPAYGSASDMEYGSTDHHATPKAVFRLYQDTFAANAGDTIARVIEGLVAR